MLVDLNNRTDFGGGDYIESGVFYRRNKDDYAFDRFAPLGPLHPYQHTTWEYGAGSGGRIEVDGIIYAFHAEETSDALRSTSLIFGPYHSRTLEKMALVPEKSWASDGGVMTLKAGATYDDSNRASGVFSPVSELAQTWNTGPVQRMYASFSTTTEMPDYTALDSSPTSGLFFGNPNLVRQTSRDSELGVSGGAWGWTGKAAVFYRDDDNLIDWTYTTGIFGRTANAVDVDTEGLELVARRSWNLFSVVLGYTALAKSYDYLGAPVTASFYALNYARQRLTAALLMRLTETIEMRMDNCARIQEPDALRTQGGNEALTSSLGIDWHPQSVRKLEFTVQIDNLWNSAFQSVPGVPASRRQLSFGATYGW